jgi:hypothetical protein
MMLIDQHMILRFVDIGGINHHCLKCLFLMVFQYTCIVVQKNRKGRNVTSILIFDLSVSDIVMRVDIFF